MYRKLSSFFQSKRSMHIVPGLSLLVDDKIHLEMSKSRGSSLTETRDSGSAWLKCRKPFLGPTWTELLLEKKFRFDSNFRLRPSRVKTGRLFFLFFLYLISCCLLILSLFFFYGPGSSSRQVTLVDSSSSRFPKMRLDRVDELNWYP